MCLPLGHDVLVWRVAFVRADSRTPLDQRSSICDGGCVLRRDGEVLQCAWCEGARTSSRDRRTGYGRRLERHLYSTRRRVEITWHETETARLRAPLSEPVRNRIWNEPCLGLPAMRTTRSPLISTPGAESCGTRTCKAANMLAKSAQHRIGPCAPENVPVQR